jgi:WD40 repeat protein
VGQDNTLKVWKLPALDSDCVEVNSAQMTIMAHQKYINAVKISPNDKLIATSS